MNASDPEINGWNYRRVLVDTYEECGDTYEVVAISEVYYDKQGEPIMFSICTTFVAGDEENIAKGLRMPTIRKFHRTGKFNIPLSWRETPWRPHERP